MSALTYERIESAVLDSARDVLSERGQSSLLLEPQTPLADAGIDSLGLVSLFVRLEQPLGFSLMNLGAVDRPLTTPSDISHLLFERIGAHAS